VYDIVGREVKTLVNTERSPGVYSIHWNGDNNYGSKVASGIYLYRVVAGNFTQVKKMILLK
jgi:flagellar hook assembly protein FlgD